MKVIVLSTNRKNRTGPGKIDLAKIGEKREGWKNPDFTASAYRASPTSSVVRHGRRKMTPEATAP